MILSVVVSAAFWASVSGSASGVNDTASGSVVVSGSELELLETELEMEELLELLETDEEELDEVELLEPTELTEEELELSLLPDLLSSQPLTPISAAIKRTLASGILRMIILGKMWVGVDSEEGFRDSAGAEN